MAHQRVLDHFVHSDVEVLLDLQAVPARRGMFVDDPNLAVPVQLLAHLSKALVTPPSSLNTT